MITKESYVTASFIDKDRKTIEVMLSRENPNEVTPYIIEADEDNIDYQDLLKIVSLDDLHQITHETKKAEGEAFKEFALSVAKDSGLVAVENQVEKTKLWPSLIEAVFNNKENDEDLFALKLALFEVETIRGSTNAAVKTKLRKSKTKFDILRFAFEIAEEVVVEPKKKATKKK